MDSNRSNSEYVGDPVAEAAIVSIGPTDLSIEFSAPSYQTPAKVYLSELSSRSQETMYYALLAVARIMKKKNEDVDIYTFPWHSMHYAHIMQLRNVLKDNYSMNTANLYLAAVKGVLRACWKLDLITHEEFAKRTDFDLVQGSQLPKGRSLTEEEINAMMDACKRGDRISGIRDAFVISWLYSGGFRRSEFASLQYQDVEPYEMGELKGYKVPILKGKGNKDRIIFINPDAAAYADAWLEIRGHARGSLMCRIDILPRISMVHTQTVYDLLKRRAAQAGIKTVHPHDLRRTFITHLLERGVDLFTVQKLAGHSLVDTTRKYDMRGENVLAESAFMLGVRN